MESKTEKTDVAPNTAPNIAPNTGRNEPCPCGSGKKYKRCHGVDAAPKLNQPAALASPSAPSIPGMPDPSSFDPSKMDPKAMAQMMGALQRLPKGQLQRLQALMQKAMAGKDVSKEAAEFEKLLPLELRNMAAGFMGQNGQAAQAGSQQKEMDANEAKRIVQEAVASGKISAEEAAQLLNTEVTEKKASLWDRIRGKSK